MGWRDHLPIHPAADLFPLMSESELRELGEDIKKNGLRYPIVLWRKNGKGKTYLLDGRNRLEAMESVGISAVDEDGSFCWNWSFREGEPYDLALSFNVHRRHLTGEQTRELVAKLLKAKPGQSNRKIAKQTKADHKTVAAVRGDLESTGEIPQLEKTIGADGKQRKSRTKKTPKPSPAEIERDRKECVALYQKVTEAEKEAARTTRSAEVSVEQRRAENAALADPIPTEEEADESWQNDLYDQACLLQERMTDVTRQRFFAYLTAGEDIVEQCLSLLMAMTKDDRAQFFAKYTELSAARAPARP